MILLGHRWESNCSVGLRQDRSMAHGSVVSQPSNRLNNSCHVYKAAIPGTQAGAWEREQHRKKPPKGGTTNLVTMPSARSTQTRPMGKNDRNFEQEFGNSDELR